MVIPMTLTVNKKGKRSVVVKSTGYGSLILLLSLPVWLMAQSYPL